MVKLSKSARREERLGYLFISPWILGFLAFAAFPILASLALSFMHWDIYASPSWIGLDNFNRLFRDPLFYKSMKVTLTYSAMAIPLG
ncbi:ABC transporter permease, partial [Paenibacillus sepulcri]|nr:ABC transporter permease [Paenibacillus sepulcri]